MRGHLPQRLDLVLAAVGLAAGVGAGVAAGRDLGAGILVVGGAVLVVLTLTRPVALGLLAVVGVWAVQRTGGSSLAGGSGGVSFSDLLLVLAAAIAVPSLATGPQVRRLRGPLIGLAIYLVCLLPTVLLDDSTRGWFEWVHRIALVGGALVVGAWITREGKTRLALRLLLALSCGMAVLAVIDSARHGFAPAYPVGLNKNFVGAQLSIVLVLGLFAGAQLGLRRGPRTVAIVLLVAGLLATQSRGSMIAAAAGALMVSSFQPRAHSRQGRGAVLMVGLVLVAFSALSVRADFDQDETDFANNSIGVRRQVEQRTLEIWRESPVHGVGLKYFFSGEYGPLAQASNIVVDNELAESGVIGLVGFLVMQGTVISAAVRRGRRDPFVLTGAACVTASLVHGMVDIYWGAGVIPLPFLVLGLALGADPPLTQSTTDGPKARLSTLASTSSQPR